MATTMLYHGGMSDTYTLQRMTDKAYFTPAGGFSKDRAKAVKFDSFDHAKLVQANMRVVTATYINRIEELTHVS